MCTGTGQRFVPRVYMHKALNTVAGGTGIIYISQTSNLSL